MKLHLKLIGTTWHIHCTMHGSDGVTHRVRTSTKHDQQQRKLAEGVLWRMLNSIAEGSYAPKNGPDVGTYGEVLDLHGAKPSGLTKTHVNMVKRVCTEFGHVRLDALKPAMFLKWLNGLSITNTSKRSVVTTINASINNAITDLLMDEVPHIKLKKPTE